MPKSLPEVKTHPFITFSGRLVRIVDNGHWPVYLETSDARFVGWCPEVGPEILKLAEQGRALWNALDGLLRAYTPAAYDRAHSLARAALNQTAATFDHNEPEVPHGQ